MALEAPNDWGIRVAGEMGATVEPRGSSAD
jgi:hypothetical protein